MAGPIGLQQLLRMQGIEWGDSANGDKHLWIDGSLNFDGPILLSGVPTNGLTTQLEIDDSSGNQIFTVRPNIPSSPAAAQNTVFIRGQMPSLLTSNVDSYVLHVRGAGQGSSALAGQSVLRVHFLDTTDPPYLTNYTGSKLTSAGNFQSNAQGTGITPFSGPLIANAGVISVIAGTTAGWNIGLWGVARASTTVNVGTIGFAAGAVNSEVVNVGVLGMARLAGQVSVSGYFYVGSNVEPTINTSACIIADVAATAVPMFIGILSGTARFTIDSKGNTTIAPSATTTVASGATALSITPGNNTNITAESTDVAVATHTLTITGGYATQRFTSFAQPVISAATSLTVTTAATVNIDGPPTASGAGPAVITNAYSFRVGTGSSIFGGALIQGHATAAINSTNTATAAQAATGYITSTSAAPTTITLPTGTALGAALGAVQGTTFELTIDNTAGSSTVTIAVAVNGILSAEAAAVAASAGLLTIPSGVTGQGTFKLMFSSATAYTFTRIA